jgi:hypothetical protein
VALWCTRMSANQRLPLVPPHPACNHVDLRASVPSEILDGVLLDRLGFHVQLCPTLDAFSIHADHGFEPRSLGLFPTCRNLLGCLFGGSRGVVNVLSDDLVWADGRPPETSVDDVGEEEGDGFGEDRRGVGFQGERLDELDEVRVGVSSRTGKTERGADRCFGCTEHDGEGLGDVENVSGSGSGLTVVEVEQGGVGCGYGEARAQTSTTRARPPGTPTHTRPIHSQAIAFNNQSSPPNKGPGLAIVASGNASLTATSPSYLVR